MLNRPVDTIKSKLYPARLYLACGIENSIPLNISVDLQIGDREVAGRNACRLRIRGLIVGYRLNPSVQDRVHHTVIGEPKVNAPRHFFDGASGVYFQNFQFWRYRCDASTAVSRRRIWKGRKIGEAKSKEKNGRGFQNVHRAFH